MHLLCRSQEIFLVYDSCFAVVVACAGVHLVVCRRLAGVVLPGE